MAIYHLTTAPIKRRTGRSATAAAAYRAADKVLDERTGEVHDYTKKQGVVASFVLVPEGEKRPSRADLWNMAEGAEKRADARVAREWEIALPHELQDHERKALAGDIARYLVERYGVAADVSIHAPTGKGDDRNYHAHILTTTRKLEGGKLTEKADFELDNKQTKARGIASTMEQLKDIRAVWAGFANRQLRRVNALEIDHRSHKARGLETLPTVHLGPKNTHLERCPRPYHTEKGDLNREIKLYNEKIEEKMLLLSDIIPKIELQLDHKRSGLDYEKRALQDNLVKMKQHKESIKKHNEALQKQGIIEQFKNVFSNIANGYFLNSESKKLNWNDTYHQNEIKNHEEAILKLEEELAAMKDEFAKTPMGKAQAKEQERLRKEKEEKERAKEQERLRKEKEEKERAKEQERLRKEKEEKEREQERLRKEKEHQERLKRLEELEKKRAQTPEKDMGRGR